MKTTTYICILRGINVSGHRMIKMDALLQLFIGLGFNNVKTYIQSGNVVFQGKTTDQKKLAHQIATAISKTFGFEVPVMVKTYEELKQIVKDNPYAKQQTKDPRHLHLTFLADMPVKENMDKIKAEAYQPEEFRLIGDAIYLYCPNNYGNSKLTNSFFENKLKVTATTRNWKTTNELLNIAEKIVTT